MDLLLKEGFKVRGTVRQDKPWLTALFTNKYGANRYETVIVPDLSAQEELEKVLHGVWGFLHVVSHSSTPEKVQQK